MITGSGSCFPMAQQGSQMYAISQQEDMVSSSIEAPSAAANAESHSGTLLYNLSLLKDKIHQVQALAHFFISPDQNQQPSESTAIAVASIGTLIQEIIVTATSVMCTCQHMALGVGSTSGNNNATEGLSMPSSRIKPLDPGSLAQNFNGNRDGVARFVHEERGQGFYLNGSLDWYGNDSFNTACNITKNNSITHVSNNNENNVATRSFHDSSVRNVSNKNNETARRDLPPKGEKHEGIAQLSPKNYDIVELDAADILAKYTHYCQVCGKGFKRDANLRMHMRAHGDEYKSNAALSNPMKNKGGEGKEEGHPNAARKYSCPHEGCRWNRKHAKFQPLKSMICVKNHYKRSHCPKMYVCKRCNRKQFSVLSDLRTHEKHCGDLKWQCSCGTTFSRKDKLMGHVALFVGHTPAVSSLAKLRKVDQNAVQIHLEEG